MKKQLICIMLFSSAAVTVQANSDIRWDYLGLGYTDAAGDGPYIEGSLRVAPSWVLQGEFSPQTVASQDFNAFRFGVTYLSGFKLDFTPNSQTYLQAGIDGVSGDRDDTGAFFGIGARHPLTPQVELLTEASYHTLGDNYGSATAGIAYYFSPDWALRSTLSLNSGDTKNVFRFGMTYQF
ncbi:hypothetical protein [Alishewanella sp. SMS8]|uniref:hypothetical protein n=1 Tax=Alishewanella sp. SMS8 TaxID=2994676 RepID=UPI002740B51B|nr:hypothetical protein [Alishewanella sp. SMS8]MDP5459312.1 hypothetical protein [Alishewanella sp. SMS8]